VTGGATEQAHAHEKNTRILNYYLLPTDIGHDHDSIRWLIKFENKKKVTLNSMVISDYETSRQMTLLGTQSREVALDYGTLPKAKNALSVVGPNRPLGSKEPGCT
jgi:hypothetical protein